MKALLPLFASSLRWHTRQHFLRPTIKPIPNGERYREATSIKEGMTVADLQKVFTQDGGLQSTPNLRYILKSCMWIKIDVELDVPPGENRRYPPSANLRIKKVSKPYLEQMILD